MMDTLNFAHQMEIFDPANARKTVVFGVGSVGSWLVEFLCRIGVRDIEVWDDQSVASDNLPYSRYLPEHIGMYKVEALRQIMKSLGVELAVHRERYTAQVDYRNASIVSCVDDMDARRIIWEMVKRQRVSIDLLCDTRAARAYVEVLSIAPCDAKDVHRYEAMLFPNEEAILQTCGEHSIAFASSRAAGIVAANLTQFWTNGTKKWLKRERCDTLEEVP